jgi:glutathione S-transferase
VKLYYSPGACSLAPHIVLRELARHFDLDRVDLESQRTAGGLDFRAINPKGQVPTLELAPGGDVVTEVPAILEYLADLRPDLALAPPAGSFARVRLEEVLSFVGSLHTQLAPLRGGEVPDRYARIVRGKVGEEFVYLQELLVDRAFLLGETFGIADAYLFALLQWCGKLGIDLQLFPNLEDYEHRVSQRPAVVAAMDAEGLRRRHGVRRSA